MFRGIEVRTSSFPWLKGRRRADGSPLSGRGADAVGSGAHRNIDTGKWTAVLLFLPPALLLFSLFVVVPICEAAWFSVFNWNGFGRPTHWIGLENYRFVFEN